MKKITIVIALLVGVTYSMNAMSMAATNVQTEVSLNAESVIDVYMNAGEDEVYVPGITGSITSIMPGVLHYSPAKGGIIISQLFKAFEEEIETPGAQFTITIIADGGSVYTIIVHVQ